MSETNMNESSDESAMKDAVRWLIVLVAAFAIFWLLLFARGAPGVGGRQPDPPGAAASMLSGDLDV